MVQSVLFVCLGNICRSPTAEGVARHVARDRDLSVEIDSAGTGDWHIGAPPYGPMQAAALARGFDLSGLRARQVSVEDFRRFDLIVAMDAANHRDLVDLRPDDASARLARFTDWVAGDLDGVPDPYHTRDFDQTLDIVEAGIARLMDDLA